MLLLLLLLPLVAGPPPRAHRVVVNYEGPHTGWITLSLDRRVLGTKSAHITSIEWCESPEVNPARDSKAVIRELRTCGEAGLLHIPLYPALVHIEPHDPNVIYVDPAHVGGWDEEHQAQIVVDATFDGGVLTQIFRFNPLYERIPVEAPAAKPVEVPQSAAPVEVPTAKPPPVEVPTAKPHPVEISTGGTSSSGSPAGVPSTGRPVGVSTSGAPPSEPPPVSWAGMGAVLGIGIALLVSAAYIRRRAPPAAEADWANIMMRTPEEDDEAEREHNLRLLMSMGTGANAVFLQNL